MEIKMQKVGNIVEGKVVEVSEKTIYLDIKYFTEAKMHVDNYDPKLESFIGVIKKGDIVKGRIQKISMEDPTLILMSRLPIIKNENFEIIKKLVETKEAILAKVKKVADKGLLLNYLDYELFLPFALLDYEFVDKKDFLKGKELKVNVIEASKKGKFIRIVASRKEIFAQERQEILKRKAEERQDELTSIQTGDILEGTVIRLEEHAAIIKFNHISGMLRISQISHHRIEKIEEVLKIDDKIKVKVIKKEGNRLDLSLKALIDTPFEIFLKENNIGDTIKGKVVQKLPFGIILELQKDVRGLLHKNEYSWNPNDNYDNYVKIGDEIDLKILTIDKKSERVNLSKKALEDNPWKNVTFKRGDIVKANVSKITDKGIEVLLQGVLGFIPANEIKVETNQIGSYYSPGDEVEAIIIEANKNNWNLKLSIKMVENKKERESFEKYLKNEETDIKQTIGDLFADKLKK